MSQPVQGKRAEGGRPEISAWRAALGGALCAVVGIFPVAIVVGLVFRFPVPFMGMASGWEALEEGPRALAKLPLMLAGDVVVYGLLGGFPLLAVLGSLGGLWARRATRHRPHRFRRYLLCAAGVLDLTAALLLAVLDWIIGPW